ncbi:hypothetical protein ACQ9BO_17430 [Flavobacterium sp. P21]|uniref:hypothetical protein n=1 Tax=Flavobacterium sp. P21 TaxID=3423948 RepID=UPI003D664B6B
MEATNDLICADNFYMRLGNIYSKMEYDKEAIEMYEKSFEAGTKYISSGTYYKSIMLINESLCKAKKYQEALDYIIKKANYILLKMI